MAAFIFTDPNSGAEIEVEVPGNTMPTGDQLRQMFAENAAQQAPSFTERLIAPLEATVGLISRVVAPVVAGGAAGLTALDRSTPEGAAAETFADVREALTFQPRTQGGREILEAQIAAGETALTVLTAPAVGAVSGLAGGIAAATPGLEEGVGARTAERVQQALI